MSGENLVIVESPAKAKTINKYLGSNYTVLASYGHVRDLPAKDGSVRPDEDFAMDWELGGDRARHHLDAIAQAARGAKRIYLATDPDREGEAISWHVQEVLRDRRGLGALDFKRITFHEITRGAVLDAIRNPRALNRELIEAYLARRALDYLVGFTLSPVLWRKLPGSRSAGRVQSVALRLICEREAEIEDFRQREFWTVEVVFRTGAGEEFTARLTHLDGRKLDKFDLADEAAALAAVARLEPLGYRVDSVERKQVRRNPYPPFTTSTLQQEASRKLGLGASVTMRLAQRLYEGVDIGGETVGLITYMRTDGLTLAAEAVDGARKLIAQSYGDRYLPAAPRVYKTTAKNAQEAHEAIRPTDMARRPAEVAPYLGRDELRLYELIWKRTMACQMASAILDQVAVDVGGRAGDGPPAAMLRATGSIVQFDGFLRVYEEDRDDPNPERAGADDANAQRRLPAMAEGDGLARTATRPEQHFTQPPPRYTEASLVKRLEELGIGRPSTYASILQVLQDRDYVRLEKKRFHPEDRGRLVTAFLTSFFRRYVEYDFTAKLEEQLDDVSGGRIDWKTVLRDFWHAFAASVEDTRELSITQVIDAIDRDLGPHFFPERPEGGDPRGCPACGDGRLGLRLSRTGAFIGCSNYPDCRYTRPLEVPRQDSGAAAEEAALALPKLLGEDPETGRPVSLRKGPFGFYVQLGDGEAGGAKAAAKAKGGTKSKGAKAKGVKGAAAEAVETEAAPAEDKPKRVSLPKGLAPAEVTLEIALALLALPRTVGRHPDTGETITAGLGRFGPYLKHGSTYRSLPEDDDVLTIGMNRAVELLANTPARASAEPLRVIGDHPADGQPIAVFKGRYGPYVRHGKVMASLPRGREVEQVGLDEAMEWLAAKAARSGDAGPGRAKANGRKAGAAAAKAKGTAASAASDPAEGKKPARSKTAPRSPAVPAPAEPAAAARRTGTKAAPAKPKRAEGAPPVKRTAGGRKRADAGE